MTTMTRKEAMMYQMLQGFMSAAKSSPARLSSVRRDVVAVERSMVRMPPGCGLRKVLTGVAEKEFQTTSMESSPASASQGCWGA